MSIRPSHRVTSLLLRPSLASERDDEVAVFAATSAPTDGTAPNGEAIASDQPAVVANAGAAVPGDLLHVTVDGGTTYFPIAVQQPYSRIGLSWVAGARGKPGVNGDIQNAAEATRMVADPDFEVQGTNAASGSVTFNAEGGIKLTTAGADGDEVIVAPHQDANQSAWKQWTWGTDKELIWEAEIETDTNITNAIIWAGLKLTSAEATATDDDQVFFRYEDDVNDGEWQAVSSIGGTDDAHDTGVVGAVSTLYRFKIVIDSSRVAKMYINGTLVETTDALTDEVDLVPFIGVAADGAAAAKALIVYGQRLSRTAG